MSFSAHHLHCMTHMHFDASQWLKKHFVTNHKIVHKKFYNFFTKNYKSQNLLQKNIFTQSITKKHFYKIHCKNHKTNNVACSIFLMQQIINQRLGARCPSGTELLHKQSLWAHYSARQNLTAHGRNRYEKPFLV